MRIGVAVFPGSNCDRDALHAIDDVLGAGTAEAVWHERSDLDGLDALVLPGGFSWGDYLRCGAMARLAPVMRATAAAVEERALPVLGICNGFQVLCEAGLLPGALLANDHGQFRCDVVDTRIEAAGTAWTSAYGRGDLLALPIAHGEGRYHADEDVLDQLERDGRVVARYADGASPNGAMRDIAGICDGRGVVVGMMPHPERAVHAWLGSDDGARVFESIRQHLAAGDRVLAGTRAD